MFTIIGLGEVLWDIFEDGKALGGAPCNFAYHVRALGHEGVPLTRVGTDELGREIVELLEQSGLPTDRVQRDRCHPTGRVTVKLHGQGSPQFTIIEDVAWDYMEADRTWLETARGAHAVCFGTLAQRSPSSRKAIRAVLTAAAGAGACIVCDLNFRQHFYDVDVVRDSLARSQIVKLNEEEVAALCPLLGEMEGEEEMAHTLIGEFDARLVCVTRGERGCTLYAAGEVVSAPVPPVKVVDTVGSGDAFTAGMVIKHLEGRPLAAIAEAANLLGSFVAGKRGAMPRLDASVADRFGGL